MPDVANTPIKICSRASLLIGGDVIQSFDDGTAEATICDAMYEDMARSALTSSRWRFSTDQAVLNRLTDAPSGRWDAANYQMTQARRLHSQTQTTRKLNTSRFIAERRS
jgi:hypothetical protein